MSLSDTLVFCALNKAAGLAFGTDRDAFCDFLNLSPVKATAYQLGASQSCCATAVRAELAAAGVDGLIDFQGKRQDVLRVPYADLIGQAFALLETLAMKAGAWNANPNPDDIQAGTIVLIEGPAHVFVVTERLPPAQGRVQLETVEGGQPDAKNGGLDTAILKKTRALDHGGGRLVIGRPVYGVIQVDKLPALPQPSTS